VRFVSPYDLYLLCVIASMKIAGWSSSLRRGEFFAPGVAFTECRLSRRTRQLGEWNVTQTLGLIEAEIPNIAKKSCYEFWYDFFSLLPSGLRRPVRKAVELQGMEHLQRALRKGKGVILWESTSFGRRLWAKRLGNC
jgi:lauroyl/myristoyl acyltransferase